MTYYCGIGPGLGALAREPCVECDGCGARVYIDGFPPRWFLDKKPKPGWSLMRTEHEDGRVTRDDRCPKCRAAPKRNRVRAKRDLTTSVAERHGVMIEATPSDVGAPLRGLDSPTDLPAKSEQKESRDGE